MVCALMVLYTVFPTLKSELFLRLLHLCTFMREAKQH